MNKNAEIEQEISEIYHKNHGNYGYRRITLMLKKIWTINHKKVQAIMQKLGLKGKHDYIHYYNNERIQVKLKGLSPMEYRTQSLN